MDPKEDSKETKATKGASSTNNNDNNNDDDHQAAQQSADENMKDGPSEELSVNPPLTAVHVRFSSDTLRNNRGSRLTIPTRPQRSRKTSLLEHSGPEYSFVVGLGMFMAFTAGYSNAVCMSGNMNEERLTQSVAGVTGLYTGSAIALLNGNIASYRRNVGVILSVLVGAGISSISNPYPIPFHLCPRYGIAFLVGGCLATLGASQNVHNEAREFYFTAMANGIMNGVSSMYTSNLIRTTHLTGTTTDIGLFLGQLLCGNRVNLWKLYILSGLAISFWSGSLAGYKASLLKRELSLIVNAGIFFVFGVSIIVYNYASHKDRTLWEAVFGVGFCSLPTTSVDQHQHHDEYHKGCIDTERGIFSKCGSGVWCCKPSSREIDRRASHQVLEEDHHDDGKLLQSHNDRIALHGKEDRITKEELMQVFDFLDPLHEGNVSIHEFLLEVLHAERNWDPQQLEEEPQRPSEVSRHSHRTSYSHTSVRSNAMNSIDSLRIATIREFEATGHPVQW